MKGFLDDYMIVRDGVKNVFTVSVRKLGFHNNKKSLFR